MSPIPPRDIGHGAAEAGAALLLLSVALAIERGEGAGQALVFAAELFVLAAEREAPAPFAFVTHRRASTSGSP
jgi:hypothetical protein